MMVVILESVKEHHVPLGTKSVPTVARSFNTGRRYAVRLSVYHHPDCFAQHLFRSSAPCCRFTMSSTVTSATYRCYHLAARIQKRSLSSHCLRLSSTSSSDQHRRRNGFKPSRRWQSTNAATAATSPKISTIVDQISQLTLLETGDLVASLKVRSQTT